MPRATKKSLKVGQIVWAGGWDGYAHQAVVTSIDLLKDFNVIDVHYCKGGIQTNVNLNNVWHLDEHEVPETSIAELEKLLADGNGL